MATIKSFTDLEQSKKLAEILSLESADMYYTYGAIVPDIMIGSKQDYRCYTICWSLAALLSILPEIKGDKPIIALYDNYITYPYVSGLHTKADNLIDACYEMILKLHKLKML